MSPKRISLICERCGGDFIGPRYRRKPSDGPRRYCSTECRYAGALTDRRARFWSQVNTSGDCWMWTGAQKSIYGGFWLAGWQHAHRAAWILERGAIPDGLHVLHACDNPGCVRLDHLFLGTHAENMADMSRKGRARGRCSNPATLLR